VGSVHGEYNVGGLVGYLQGVIDRSFTSGIVKGESAVGGIAGEVQGDHSCSNSNSPGEITNTYTYSTVKGSEGAGISGYNGGLISASYAGGYVEDLFGGGITSYTTGTITHSFWNTSVTNQQWSDGMNGKDYALLSDSAQFKRQSYYYWDFDSTWMMNEGETHPVLQDMETPPFAAPDTFAVGSSFNLVRLMDNDFDGGSPDASLTLSIETIDGQGTTDSLTWYSFSQSVPKGTQDTVFYRLMKQLNSGDTLWSRGVAFLTNSVNTAPIATVDTIVVAEDGAYTIDPQLFIANDYDTENDFISLVSYVSTGLTGGVVADGTSIVYTPLNNWNGSSIITYVVSDGDLTATGNVVVVVTPSNDGPTLTETYPQNMLEEAALTVSLAMTDGADIDGDALQVIVGVGEYYTVAGAVVTPVKDYVGSLAVPVRVTDGVDTTAVVTLVVTVTDVPESTNTGTAGTIPDTSNPVIPVGGGDMDVTSSSLAQESSSVLYEGSIDDGGLSSAASVGYSSSSLDSTGVSPVLFNGYQGTGYSRMVRMSDVSYTIQHAPEFANSYTLYSIHGKKITEGSVHMGESSLPPFLTHGLVIVKFH
ncbi:MAG: cadherin-like domain-containing protein, partial [Fibrobacterales bacterium]